MDGHHVAIIQRHFGQLAFDTRAWVDLFGTKRGSLARDATGMYHSLFTGCPAYTVHWITAFEIELCNNFLDDLYEVATDAVVRHMLDHKIEHKDNHFGNVSNLPSSSMHLIYRGDCSSCSPTIWSTRK